MATSTGESFADLMDAWRELEHAVQQLRRKTEAREAAWQSQAARVQRTKGH